MARSLCLLTQFMSSYEPCFLFTISWILRLKNACFVPLTVLYKDFQSSRLFDLLYFSKSLLYFLFYQLFKYFVTLIIFEFFTHTFSTILARSFTVFSKWGISDKFVMSRFLMNMIISLMNYSSSSLFLMIDLFLELIFSSTIGIIIVRGIWLEVGYYLEWIKWLSSLVEPYQKI